MEEVKFVNGGTNKFSDISTESYRTYVWADGFTVTITDPTWLNVSKSGGHRLFDKSGISHYIQPGWRHLFWDAGEGPHFVL